MLSEMKRLVEINAAVNYGSTGRIAEAIGLVAQREGWECTMVHGPRYVNPSQLPCICTQGKWGDRMHGVRSLLLDGHGLGSKRATERLVRRLDALQPDVVHLHNVHGYYLNYEVLFRWLQRADCKVVWTLHDCWPFTGHCTYFDFIGCDRWKSGCHDCPQLRAYPRSLFVDRTRRNYELKRELFTSLGDRLTLVPVSHWLEELVKESFFKGTAVQTIYNGIDTNVFRPRGNKPARDYVLGVASPWCERKGFNDFIALRSELPADVDIVLVGLTRKQVEALPDGIVGIERTQNVDQLAELYSGATLFANPTYEDNFPTTNLEAMACGTPVVTYRTGGSPEAVTSETGFVVDKGNIKAIADVLQAVHGRGKQKYEEACRQRAVTCFNKDDRYADYVRLYNRVCQ